MNTKKNPTGIDSLDPVLQGGLPSGSLILLLGQTGAGEFEFSISSISRLLQRKAQNGTEIFPGKICYVSFTRSREDVLREIAFSFPEFYKELDAKMEFKDFSEAYFARSFIPVNWRSGSERELTFESLKWDQSAENLIAGLVNYLDKNAAGSIIIIDSLTVLARYCLERMEWKDLIMFLRGLQKASKKWDGLIYTILTEGIFEKERQEEIQECMDGVIVFEWDLADTQQRQRIMYLKKFRGLLPLLAQDNIVNFETRITSQKGFEVSNIKTIRGR